MPNVKKTKAGTAKPAGTQKKQISKKSDKVPTKQKSSEAVRSKADAAEQTIQVGAKAEAPLATPFSDGIVVARLNNLAFVPRSGGDEVDILRSFLKYYSSSTPFVGTISSKLSFMRKKGGRLL